jgi:hypothetical protein
MKKVALAVLVIFLGFWLFTDPNGLAASSKSAGSGAWTATESMFRSVIDFLHAL